MHTVGELATLAGVSVRTLHHYDELGLVVPSARTAANYRLYDHADLERLQEVLALRAFGLPLAEVAGVLEDPSHDRVAVLRAQAERLRHERERLGGLLAAVEDAIAAHERGVAQEMTDMFDGQDHEALQAEAEQRWGDTDAWRQSQQRTGSWGDTGRDEAAQWWSEHFSTFAALHAEGVPRHDDRVLGAVAAHRALVNRFYDCDATMQRNLAVMYVADARFTATYDAHGEGLAQYVHDAIRARAHDVAA